MSDAAELPLKRPPDWWDRNWKWFLPTLVIGVLTFFAVAFALFVGVVLYFMKSSDAYKMGLAAAQESPALIEVIGEPIEPGWLASGSVHINGSSGDADYSIPVKGPHGKATVYILAKRELGEWQLTRAVAEIESSDERLDLLGTQE